MNDLNLSPLGRCIRSATIHVFLFFVYFLLFDGLPPGPWHCRPTSRLRVLCRTWSTRVRLHKRRLRWRPTMKHRSSTTHQAQKLKCTRQLWRLGFGTFPRPFSIGSRHFCKTVTAAFQVKGVCLTTTLPFSRLNKAQTAPVEYELFTLPLSLRFSSSLLREPWLRATKRHDNIVHRTMDVLPSR